MQDEKKRNSLLVKEPETEVEDFKKARTIALNIAKIARTREHINTLPNDPTQAFLHDYWLINKSSSLYSAFLAADIRGFTQISYEKNAKEIARIVSIFSNIAGSLTSLCGGYVLKFLGDGFISFFPTKDVKHSVKRALLCSYALSIALKDFSHDIHNLFNESFEKQIAYGIGCDIGCGVVVKIGSPYSKVHYDIIGKPINVSMKIQRISEKGNIITTQNIFDHAKDYKVFFKKLNIKEKSHPAGFIGWLTEKTLFFRSRKPEVLYSFNPELEEG